MLGLKDSGLLPSYFDYIFVHLKQKARLRLDLSPKFLSTSGPNPTRKARPDLQLWVIPQTMAKYFSWMSSAIKKISCLV